MEHKKIIAIIGLMGVGKSSLGKKLAEKLGYYFIDSDSEIEDLEGKSVSQIFKDHGENYFRKREEEVIKSILTQDENMIVSLGGGAFINPEIRKSLKLKAVVIWLDASIDSIIKRIGSKSNRPLLKSGNKRKTLEELRKVRDPIYAEADFRIDTTNHNRDHLIEQIIENLKWLKT